MLNFHGLFFTFKNAHRQALAAPSKTLFQVLVSTLLDGFSAFRLKFFVESQGGDAFSKGS